jgi:hypothetical protein
MSRLVHKVDKFKFILTNVQFRRGAARRAAGGPAGLPAARFYGPPQKGFLAENKKIFLTLLT